MPKRVARQISASARFLAIAAIFIASAAHAQQMQPTDYAGFSGQTVSKIEIAARPGVDMDAIRQMIVQKAGQPFSADAVRQSVAALQQTHLFTEIQMSMVPEEAGLNLTFILQPADYVGVIEFPGVGTRFPYTALMQAASIPEQSPYTPGLENQARTGLLNFLHTRGFYSAEVTPQIDRDEPHHIVNIILHCSLGSQARIGQIEFTGIGDQRAAGVRRALGGWWPRLKRISLRRGQKYSRPRVIKSVPYIRDNLRVAGQLPPSIQLGTPNYNADTNRVNVNFKITPGPKVMVKVEGTKLSDKKLHQLVPFYQEGAVDLELVDEGEDNINGYFQSKGYFDSKTDSSMTRQDDGVSVVYTVDRGKKHRLKEVDFSGNRSFSDKDLASQVAVKPGFLFLTRGRFSQELLNKSVTSLTQLYRDAGFQNVSINPKVQDFDPQVYVTFQIAEGRQDRVASLHLEGNASQTLAALSRKYPLQMRVGQAYSAKLMDTDRNQILAAYLDLGYLNATVQPSASPTKADPTKMDVTFAIQEGPRAYIADVVAVGEHHTNLPFIRIAAGGNVAKGQPQSQRNFLEAETNLYNLGVFDWADIASLRPIVNQSQEEVLIKLHESRQNSMDIGGGLEIIPRSGNVPVNTVAVPGLPPISLGNKFKVSQQSYVGPRFTFDFVRHNIRGRAETATIGTIASRLDQRVFFTYSDPYLHGSSWSSLLSISGERTTENPVYTAELANASIQLNKTLNAKRTEQLIGRYSFDRTSLYDVLIPGLVLPQDRHVRLSTFDAEYVRDSRDKPLDAHHGVYQTLDVGVTATALGASANFLRILGQSAFYIPVKPWLTWANNFRLGFALPFSNSYVPISERFFTGGADSLRGFPINGAGPQRSLAVCSNPADQTTCSLISVPVGGEMLFIVNSELRFPLPVYHGIGGAVFYDGGNVFASIRLSQFADNFTHSIGAGLRYNTPVGPVRFDFGYRITDVPGIKATQYFVTLGQSF
ncbi:MAG: POTRA domain-containing protein [Candidatus Acidiferrales bacterium]